MIDVGQEIRQNHFPDTGAVAFTLAGGGNPYDNPSIVLVGHVLIKYKSYPYYWNEQTIRKIIAEITATYELGHQRAALTHPQDDPSNHEEGFPCVMTGLVMDENYQYIPGYERFCSICRQNLQNIHWDEDDI